MNNFNIILFSMPYVFQVLLGQPVTTAYEEIPLLLQLPAKIKPF